MAGSLANRATSAAITKGGPVLFKKLFRVLVVTGAVVGAQASCATGSSSKGSGGGATANTDMSAADGGTATSSDQPSTQSSGGGGVMGW